MRVAIEDLTARATDHVHADVFRISDRQIVTRLSLLPERGVTLSVLADSENVGGRLAKELRTAASTWHELGASPLKQHGKSLTRDGGAEAIVATDIADDAATRRIELATSFEGAPARALAAVHAAPFGGGAALDDALAAAAREGVVINDPRSAVRWATSAVEQLIGGEGPVRVVTKSFGSPDLAARLADRARAGSAVEVVTHAMPKAQQATLRDAGATVRVLDEEVATKAGLALHGTMIESGGDALIGSLYLENRVLYGSKGRQSREVAAVVSGQAAIDLRAAVDSATAPLASLMERHARSAAK